MPETPTAVTTTSPGAVSSWAIERNSDHQISASISTWPGAGRWTVCSRTVERRIVPSRATSTPLLLAVPTSTPSTALAAAVIASPFSVLVVPSCHRREVGPLAVPDLASCTEVRNDRASRDGVSQRHCGSTPTTRRRAVLETSMDMHLLHRAAAAYYLDGLRQGEVADRVGVSRPTVSKLLAEARRIGMVRFEVLDVPSVDLDELASRLRDLLGVESVRIAPGDQVQRGYRGIGDLLAQ